MDARTPPLLLTPPRAAQAPPNPDTPVGRPRRHATLNLGLFGGAEALPEGRGGTNLLAPGVNTPSPDICMYRGQLKPRYRTPGLGYPGISAAPRDGPGRSRAR